VHAEVGAKDQETGAPTGEARAVRRLAGAPHSKREKWSTTPTSPRAKSDRGEGSGRRQI
jgi:hypothetical protein